MLALPGHGLAHVRPKVSHELAVARPRIMPPNVVDPVGRVVLGVEGRERRRDPANESRVGLHGRIEAEAVSQCLVVAAPFLAVPSGRDMGVHDPVLTAQHEARALAVILGGPRLQFTRALRRRSGVRVWNSSRRRSHHDRVFSNSAAARATIALKCESGSSAGLT